MFNLNIFNKIKKIHLKILNQNNLSEQIASNQYLFLTRFHPQLINRYLFYKNPKLTYRIKIFFPFFFSYLKNFFLNKNFFFTDKLENKKIIFISAFEQKFLLNKENQHIGDLIKIFEKENYIEIIKSHFPINYVKNIQIKNKYNKRRIYLKNNLGFLNELKAFYSIYMNFRKNKKKYLLSSNFTKINIEKIFSINAIFSSINNYRFYLQLSFLLKKINPKIIFFPYEGYAWERLAIKAAKTYNPKIKCIGYQKSVITKHSDLMKTNLNDNLFNPDKIICRSKIDSNKLLDRGTLSKHQIIIGGKNNKLKIKSKKFDKINVLVLPEAWLSEEKNLFHFTKLCAQQYPRINFTFRPHPSSIFDVISLDTDNLVNLKISTNSFSNDVKKNNIIFFRGSYSVIKACGNGLFPVYIEYKNDFNADINPLYEIEKNIFKISNNHQFKKIVDYVVKPKSNKRKLLIIKHCNKINANLDRNYIKKKINLLLRKDI